MSFIVTVFIIRGVLLVEGTEKHRRVLVGLKVSILDNHGVSGTQTEYIEVDEHAADDSVPGGQLHVSHHPAGGPLGDLHLWHTVCHVGSYQILCNKQFNTSNYPTGVLWCTPWSWGL